MILAPASQRPRAQKLPTIAASSEVTRSSKVRSFFRNLAENFKQLHSRIIWRNGAFLIFILSNGISAAGVVIPWTFAFDYIRQRWLIGFTGDVKAEVDAQIAWFPSLIGLGSCFGQIAFGLLSSIFSRKNTDPHSDLNTLTTQSNDFQLFVPKHHHRRMNNLGIIFSFACLFNFATTTLLAFIPVESAISVAGLSGNPGEQFILSTKSGRLVAFVCFAVGTSDGAFMTLLGLMLEDILLVDQFPAGLGISLFVSGIFNFSGTIIGGHLFDVYGSYVPSLLLASVLPLAASIIFITYHCILNESSRSPSQFYPQSVGDF